MSSKHNCPTCGPFKPRIKLTQDNNTEPKNVVLKTQKMFEQLSAAHQKISKLEQKIEDLQERAEYAESYINDSTTSGGAVRVQLEKMIEALEELQDAASNEEPDSDYLLNLQEEVQRVTRKLLS